MPIEPAAVRRRLVQGCEPRESAAGGERADALEHRAEASPAEPCTPGAAVLGGASTFAPLGITLGREHLHQRTRAATCILVRGVAA